jgi:hypothetical protein
MTNDEGPEAPGGGYDKDARMNKANPELAKMQDLSYWDSNATSSLVHRRIYRQLERGKEGGELVHSGD